jgi:hypothetical protein
MDSELGNVDITPVEREEGTQILDRAARRLLDMSGEDFVVRWEAGDTEGMDHVAAMKVAMLIPLAR